MSQRKQKNNMAARYFVYVSKSIRKSLLYIPSPWLERIEKVINMLEVEPFYGKKMTGQLADCRKIRIWPYRIIYRISEKEGLIKILEIEHRGNVSYD